MSLDDFIPNKEPECKHEHTIWAGEYYEIYYEEGQKKIRKCYKRNEGPVNP